MRLRHLVWTAPVAGAIAGGFLANQSITAAANQAGDPKQAVSLPVSRVVLFNSGVGYYAREGQIEGDARVDLQFQERDINDLLKSMTLRDFDGGRAAAVAYDSREPVARTLSSFAVNLNNNPTLSQILTQARGERVEVALQPTAQAQPGVMSGVVVGMEKQKLPSGPNQVLECDMLNILTADGLRAVKMTEVLRVKFANPTLESDLRRALDVLALSHDAQRKAVSVNFAGDGKRKVQVAYVTEAPVWKTSYRLALSDEGKPQLQAWAVVENTTDDDWADVRMALVSGRPISFQMDLYNPLFVPRPVVEPELFASLRPPTYRGGFGQDKDALANAGGEGGPGGGLGGFGGRSGGKGEALAAAPPAAAAPAAEFERKANQLRANDRFDKAKEQSEARRQFAGEVGRELQQRMDFGAVQGAATASQLGDVFQYNIDHPVTLGRQKSALLPIIGGKEVEAARISIYNPAVQAKHPLLGVRFKNTTGANLSQGPITVYDGSTYAGDARILDVQKDETRLLAYAIDLGTEVDPQNGLGTSRITSVKAQKGIVVTTTKQVEEKKYRIVNRSDKDRTVVIEHPNRTNQQFKIVDTPKPVEDTPELWRFQTSVPAGKTENFVVKEEKDFGTQYLLTNSTDDQIRFLINLNEATPELKKQLNEALVLKGKWDAKRRDLQQLQVDLNRITIDQDRIRKNLRETPKEAPVYQKYLDKLSEQEKEIDTLTAKQKETMSAEFEAKKTYENFLTGISG